MDCSPTKRASRLTDVALDLVRVAREYVIELNARQGSGVKLSGNGSKDLGRR